MPKFRGTPMRLPRPTRNHRLDELLTMLGGTRDIAPFDVHPFAQRTGELIAKSAARHLVMPQVHPSAIERTNTPRMLRRAAR